MQIYLTTRRKVDFPPEAKNEPWEDKVMHPASMGACMHIGERWQEFYFVRAGARAAACYFLKKSREIPAPEIDQRWLLCFSRHRLSHCVYIERPFMPLACKYTCSVHGPAKGARGEAKQQCADEGLS